MNEIIYTNTTGGPMYQGLISSLNLSLAQYSQSSVTVHEPFPNTATQIAPVYELNESEYPQYTYTFFDKNDKLLEATNLTLNKKIGELLKKKYKKFIWNENDKCFYTTLIVNGIELTIKVSTYYVFIFNKKNLVLKFHDEDDIYNLIKPNIITKSDIINTLESL